MDVLLLFFFFPEMFSFQNKTGSHQIHYRIINQSTAVKNRKKDTVFVYIRRVLSIGEPNVTIFSIEDNLAFKEVKISYFSHV